MMVYFVASQVVCLVAMSLLMLVMLLFRPVDVHFAGRNGPVVECLTAV